MKSKRNKKHVELLAPAGGIRALRGVLKAGADAVYLSGKRFGMRGHRASFHFDHGTMKQAVQEVHAKGARIYVTVNNLLSDNELEDSLVYISYLKDLGADAVIIQDLGLLKELHKNPPGLEIHASTMMNVHSSQYAFFVKSWGVSRIITSRDVPLSDVSEMVRRTGLEMEYFIHGDMCSAQGGLCHMSSVIFGQSANRGRCLKPCRWPWKIVKDGEKARRGAMKYLLARKDMCLVHALPEIIEAGITALKIEGRMRPAEYLEEVVDLYRRALDRYFADPFQYREEARDIEKLFKGRVRNFSSCHAFGPRGTLSMGTTGRREPRFFSSPLPEPDLNLDDLRPDPLSEGLLPARPTLCAALHSPDILDAVLPLKPDWVYILSHFLAKGQSWTARDLSYAIERCRHAGVMCGVVLPPVTPDREIDFLAPFIKALEPHPDAWMAGNPGQLSILRDHSDAALMADSLFNIFNTEALRLFAEEGVVRAALSPEISLDHLASMRRPFPMEVEYAIHGAVQAMFTEDCVLRIALDRNFDPGSCPHYCNRGAFSLENEAGDLFPIRVTRRCRNAIFFPRHLCLLHRLGKVLNAGAASLRLSLIGCTPDYACTVVQTYKKALEKILSCNKDWFMRNDLKELQKISHTGMWEAGTRYGVLPAAPSANEEMECA